MSGPISVVVTAEPVSLILAAAAIRAAQAVQEGYRQAEAARVEHAGQRAGQAAAQAAARQEGQARLLAQQQTEAHHWQQLSALALRLNLNISPLPPPESEVPEVLTAWIAAQKQLNAQLQASLKAHLAQAENGAEEGFFDLLPSQLAAAELPPAPALEKRLPDELATSLQRLLSRLAALGEAPDPARDALLAELQAGPTPARAESLLLELRQRIQQAEENRLQADKALVLRQTLADLGYQVDEVTDTLFVSGGVVHFRKAGWGDYMVRLRIDAARQTANFNVLRAVEEANNERSVRDHLAEDRWCAEFPALQGQLAARGLQLAVTRRLAAGELPVQQVRRDALPSFADEETRQTSATPSLSRPLPGAS